MPNVKSAKKRVKTNEKRRQRNRAARSTLKTGLKRLDTILQSGDASAVAKAGTETLSLIGRSGRKKVVSRKRASRLQSRIQRKLNAAAAPAPSEPTEETSS